MANNNEENNKNYSNIKSGEGIPFKRSRIQLDGKNIVCLFIFFLLFVLYI